MSSEIEKKCLSKGVRLTEQRKLVAKVMSESEDHPDVEEMYRRAVKRAAYPVGGSGRRFIKK